MPNFVYNDKTGEVGYWTGTEVITLPKSMAGDPAGAQKLLELVKSSEKPPQFGQIKPEEQTAISKLYAATRPQNPAVRGQALEAVRQDVGQLPTPQERLPTGGQMLQETADWYQAGERGLDERAKQRGYLKDALLTPIEAAAGVGIPALGGAGASSIAQRLLGPARSLAQRGTRHVISGLGSAVAEVAGQKAGVLPESTPNVLISGAAGALPGPAGMTKPGVAAQKAKKVAIGEGLADIERSEKATAKGAYKLATLRPDLDPTRITNSLDSIVNRELGGRPKVPAGVSPTTTESARDKIANDIAAVSESLKQNLKVVLQYRQGVGLPQGTPATPTGAPGLQTPKRTQIPPVAASETGIPSTPGKQAPTPSAYGTPAQQANRPQTQAPGGWQVTSITPTAAAENVVEDYLRLNSLANNLQKVPGAGGLAKQIKDAVAVIEREIPDLATARVKYASGKAHEQAKVAVERGTGASGTNRRIVERYGNVLTDQQKAGLLKAGDMSENMGVVLRTMLDSPIGRRFVVAGLTPQGEVVNSVLQLGAQAMGHEGQRILQLLRGGGESGNTADMELLYRD